MTHGAFLSVTTVATILVAVLALAVLSLVVLSQADHFSGRHSVALFWVCLAVTWLLAVVAAVAVRPTLGG